MDTQLFQLATGTSAVLAAKWAALVSSAMERWAIHSTPRICAFLAQIGEESGGFQYTQELWGPTAAQLRYEGRTRLGNTSPGDGQRFLGRGLIQITGRVNYAAVSQALGVDFLARPTLLATPPYAASSAAWFWNVHGCNTLADQSRFLQITQVINGGATGLVERERRYQLAQNALGGLPPDPRAVA